MKNLIYTFALLFLAVCTQAQQFEGTIKWSFKSDFELSEEQMQQMAAARKQLEMQLNNPEFKKQMEANPQLKKMVEQQAKVLESMGDKGMAGLFPESMIVKIKGQNARTIIDESKETLYLGSSGKQYELNPKEKTYRELSYATQENDQLKNTFEVQKTSETTTIAGYKCTKFYLTSKDPQLAAGKEMKQVLWVTTELNLDARFLKQASKGGNANWFYDQVEGIPMRIEVSIPQGNITMEATEVTKGKVSDAEFEIPAGYKAIEP
ncbi:MAG: DUF4412 domain-containing protein [Bacteroidia bacterium]|nr:DUF4412 domain-containing protein [Bacteroidia bacterium]